MLSVRHSALAAVVLAALYQVWLKDILFITLGVGRVVQPIESFPFKCRRLEDKQLEGCGDMWLDEKNRVLYAACTSLEARGEWNPSLSRFNASGRRTVGSKLVAINIDKPAKNGLFKMHTIQPSKFGNGPGDGHLDLAGFDVEVVDSSTIRFWLLNQRPPYDADGKLLDATKFGSNTTVDVYEYRKGNKKMTYVATGKSPNLHSPNKIAWMGSNNFAVSNDRSGKVGLRRKLDVLLGGGNLVYYDDWFDVYAPTPKTFPIPGHILRGKDDRVYVPSLVDDKIRVFELQENRMFEQVHAIRMGMPIAGLTIDSNEDFWAVGRSKYDPVGDASTNTVFKIEKFIERKFRYTASKVLEDRDAKFLRGASVVRHDVKTGRLFVGGCFAPFLAVCEQEASRA